MIKLIITKNSNLYKCRQNGSIPYNIIFFSQRKKWSRAALKMIVSFLETGALENRCGTNPEARQ